MFNSETLHSGPFESIACEDPGAMSETESVIFFKSLFETDPGRGLELLFKRFYTPMCSSAVRIVSCKQIAEDLVSDVFFNFYRTKAYRHVTASFSNYLFRSVRNECYTYISREFKTDSLNSCEAGTIPTYHQQPDAEIHYNNLYFKINEIIAELPSKCQEVFLMSRFENKKYNEIAGELNISPRTVEVHISRALKYIRSNLGDFLK